MCYIIIFSIVLVNLPVYGSLPETQAVQGFGSIRKWRVDQDFCEVVYIFLCYYSGRGHFDLFLVRCSESSSLFFSVPCSFHGKGETSIFSSVPLGFYIIGSMLMLIGAKYLTGQYVYSILIRDASVYVCHRWSRYLGCAAPVASTEAPPTCCLHLQEC